MWDQFEAHFSNYPGQSRVARTLLRYGLSVRAGRVWCGDIPLTATGVAGAANVDRRIVNSTVETIQSTPALARVFGHLRPTCLLDEAARNMGWGALEIVPEDAGKPGILAGVTEVIARHGVSVRQAVVDDPDLIEEPRLLIITEGPMPPEALDEVRKVEGVLRVVVPGR